MSPEKKKKVTIKKTPARRGKKTVQEVPPIVALPAPEKKNPLSRATFVLNRVVIVSSISAYVIAFVLAGISTLSLVVVPSGKVLAGDASYCADVAPGKPYRDSLCTTSMYKDCTTCGGAGTDVAQQAAPAAGGTQDTQQAICTEAAQLYSQGDDTFKASFCTGPLSVCPVCQSLGAAAAPAAAAPAAAAPAAAAPAAAAPAAAGTTGQVAPAASAAATAPAASGNSGDLQTNLGAAAGIAYPGGGPANIGVYIAKFILFFFGGLGLMFTCYIFYAGFLWLTAAGEEEKTKKARAIIFHSIFALAICIMAFGISKVWLEGLAVAAR